MWKTTRNRVRGLEQKLEDLEGHFKALEAEWDNVYDKLRVAMARMRKRAKIAGLEDSAEASGDGQAAPASEGRLATGGLLSPRQKEIQQQILRRRAGGGGT